MTQTLQTHGLPDDFANRIGRLIEARGSVVDALFDPAAMPDILAELEVSDEANRRGVNIQVVQRRGGGIVRGIATSPIDALPRGSTVLNSGHHARTPFNAAEFERTVRSLTGRTPAAACASEIARNRHQSDRRDVSARCRRHRSAGGRPWRRHDGGDGGTGAAAKRRQRSVVDLRHDAAAVAGMALLGGTRLFARRGLEEGRL